MSALSYTYSFVASTTIVAAQVNANFAAVQTVVNGGLDETNFRTLHGAVTWSITSNVSALTVASSGTAALATFSATGIWGAGVSGFQVTSNAAQTTGTAAFEVDLTNASSTIPTYYSKQAGTGAHFLAVDGSGNQVYRVDTFGGHYPKALSKLDLNNCAIAASVSGNALTVSLKQKDASTDPTSAQPAAISLRSSTATSGAIATVNTSAALSVTVPSGTTIGTISGKTHYVYVYAIGAPGNTVELAVSLKQFDEGSTQSTTAISGGSSASTLYSTTARAGVGVRLLGRLTISEATAGTWATAPTEVANVPFLGQVIGRGTPTNDSAAAGYVGEYIESTATNTSVGWSTATFGDMGNIALTPGDWDVSMLIVINPNGATLTSIDAGIGTTSGNSSAGLTYGTNAIEAVPSSGSVFSSYSIPCYRISIAADTTYYAKLALGYSVATPKYYFRLSARRVR